MSPALTTNPTKVVQTLPSVAYMSFPFWVGPGGPATSGRAAHVREQIEQILFTAPGERIFRPDFGAGVQRLVFEPNDQTLAALLTRRLQAALAPALQGEVDPKSLTVSAGADPDFPERLVIEIGYTLAAISYRERYRASLGTGGNGG
ncbi:GPW/gp25 family protein [Mesorhizobium sp. M1233]|uniref:GPW/gp25 family protein n=1 Tax=unclassified Mesorhizobium TaxID=325217 RepID=UPI00333AA93F